MIEIKLLPLVGLDVQGFGQVLLGQTKNEVKKILGKPSSQSNNQLFYDNLELRIDFKKDKTEFIECICGPFCEKTIPTIYGKQVFALMAEELIALLTEKNNGDIDDEEAEYGYSFLEISVGIYRDTVPNDIEEMIAELEQEGTYEENKDWVNADLEKSKHFFTIGIGVKDYYFT